MDGLKNKITRVQIRLIRAIKSHKTCYEKIQSGEDSQELNDEMLALKQQMIECHQEQKMLLKQLNAIDGPIYKFNLYKIPPAAIPKKIRRRKDVIQPVKLQKKPPVVVVEPVSPSSSSTSSSSPSSSDDSSDHEEPVVTVNTMPVPLPRPCLYVKSTTLLRPDSRDHRPKRMCRKMTDEEMMKDLPVYNDPPPSPEPVDEHQIKLKFMAALNLIPIGALAELQVRKRERKRRSTANNQFYYSNDWDVPVKRKQYLSPNKSKPIPRKSPIKIDVEEAAELTPEFQDKAGSEQKCHVCEIWDTLVSCSECAETFHPKCPTIPELEQSFLLCRRCGRAKNPTKPTELLPNGGLFSSDPDSSDGDGNKSHSSMIDERLKVRNHLIKVLRCRMIEMAQLERKVLQLSESQTLQDRAKMDLMLEGKETEVKIDVLLDIVTRFQMVKEKPCLSSDVTDQDKTSQPSDVTDEHKTSQPSDVTDQDKTSQPSDVTDEDKPSLLSGVTDEHKTSQPSDVTDEDNPSQPSDVTDEGKPSQPTDVTGQDKTNQPSEDNHSSDEDAISEPCGTPPSLTGSGARADSPLPMSLSLSLEDGTPPMSPADAVSPGIALDDPNNALTLEDALSDDLMLGSDVPLLPH